MISPEISIPRDVGVILAAAGSGSRYGRAKQFDLLGGIPIFERVVQTFDRIPSIHTIVIVTRAEDIEEMDRHLATLDLICDWSVIAGGATRQDSVRNGLTVLAGVTAISVALVHDVARALIEAAVVQSVIEGIRSFGSALAALPVVDTLKRGDGELVDHTISRSNLWRAQTPQGATLESMLAAFDAAQVDGFQGTDESELLERIGMHPRLVLGSELNFKLTYPEDLARAERLLRGDLRE